MENNLSEVYRSTILPRLARIESERRSLRIKITILLLGLAVLIFFGLDQLWLTQNKQYLAVYVFVNILVAAVVIELMSRNLRSLYKTSVIHPLLQSQFGECRYEAGSYVDKDTFVSSELFQRFTKLSGEDHVSGKLGLSKFELSKLYVENELFPTKRGAIHRSVFEGIFFSIVLSRDWGGTILIRQDIEERSLWTEAERVLHADEVFLRYPTLKIGNSEFERTWSMRSDLQSIPTDFPLAPLFDWLKDFRATRPNDSIFLSIKDQYFYVAWESKIDIFEPSIWGKNIGSKDLYEVFQLLQKLKKLVTIVDVQESVKI